MESYITTSTRKTDAEDKIYSLHITSLIVKHMIMLIEKDVFEWLY
jgi:hypothetical protein